MTGSVSPTSRRNGKYIYRFICSMILSLIATTIFFFVWYEFAKENNQTGHLLGKANLGMTCGIYFALYVMFATWLHAFTIGIERKANILAGQMLALFVLDVLETLLSCAITGQFRFFGEFVKIYAPMFLVQAAINCLLTVPMVNIYRKLFPPLQILEIHGIYRNNLEYKMNSIKYKYHIAKSMSIEEGEEEIRRNIPEYDAVILNDLSAYKKNKVLKMCFELNKRVYYIPKISDIIVKNSQELNLMDTPIFLNRNNGINPIRLKIKRVCDVFFSTLALVVFSPVFIIVAIAVHAEDGGPVFYRQERVTMNGQRFMMLKFRSMIVDAEKDGKPTPAGENDDRITRVGRVIRAVRLDELPQLINIIKGDMSIVGPRPERWEFVEQYSEEIEEFPYRLKMKGGLTGYAQVYGKYNTTALDKLKLDLLYITNYSILLDIQIIFETIKILLQKESTEGFEPEDIERLKEGMGNESLRTVTIPEGDEGDVKEYVKERYFDP